MAKDPICGMTVDELSPLHAERDGQNYYFCREDCRKKFVGQPRPIRTATDTIVCKRTGSVTRNMNYTCPMHPEARQDHPGTCPKCGMSLEHIGDAPGAANVEYSCPMHPQIVPEGPGSCPICGMGLEPRTVTLE